MKLTKQQSESKVYELTEKLIAVKKDQKDVNAGYKDKIKDITSEIEAIIEDFNSQATV
jgi:hypothetical protein